MNGGTKRKDGVLVISFDVRKFDGRTTDADQTGPRLARILFSFPCLFFSFFFLFSLFFLIHFLFPLLVPILRPLKRHEGAAEEEIRRSVRQRPINSAFVEIEILICRISDTYG